MENNTVDEKDGKWLLDLAVNNTVLETLNFYQTNLYLNITDIGKVGINTQDT
jgi:coronatine-insensitive protein 1